MISVVQPIVPGSVPDLPSPVRVFAAPSTVSGLLCHALGADAPIDPFSSISGPLLDHGTSERRTVAVVDGRLPVNHPHIRTLFEQLKRFGSPIVVLFCSPDELALARWIEIGADAICPDETSLPEVLQTLRRVAAGERVLGVSVREGLLTSLRSERATTAERTVQFQSLTRREAEVLEGLARGLAPEEVARENFVSLNTVRTQIRGILAKLGVGSVVAAVALAYRTEWLRPDLTKP